MSSVRYERGLAIWTSEADEGAARTSRSYKSGTDVRVFVELNVSRSVLDRSKKKEEMLVRRGKE